MRSSLGSALVLLAATAACTSAAPRQDPPVVAYETRARAGERSEAPMRMASTSTRDPRDSIRARAVEVTKRSSELAARVEAARVVGRTWRQDLGVVDDRVQRLEERMAILDELEQKGDGLDTERQWDGVFAEVQDLLAVLDELEVDVERATGPAGASAQRAAP